ncbi:PQQ-binding-like beta-propeller repeat protein [Flagellimonas pelagia]|uniref:PQQ-binding-like beta-propeller repeat protein n=2 Tax=Flagellimonas pelagia TaxID=2306998 RepID=A0A3A1NKW0_9FLAO|nr:pyrroloquinoline quinone-dependent dehydrogenase [Allomuricauda maritima]TXJ92695.1 PQQ-binding-like beta-propeller repeat protein [Allomuricauda maritima]
MQRMMLSVLVGFMVFGCAVETEKDEYIDLETGKDWPVYGGNRNNKRYSPLDQINKENVRNLEVAWVYDARDYVDGAIPKRQKAIQCQPIVKEGILYGTTPELNLFALNAATGEELWKFEPMSDGRRYNISASRGITYWEKGEDKRILYTSGSFLHAVNVRTGKAIETFGTQGRVDLHTGLAEGLDVDISASAVNATSPGIVYKDLYITGSSVSEGGNAAPGDVRAFNIITGALEWTFHTIPRPGEEGYDTWPKEAYKEQGGANSWGGMSLDVDRGVVYFGTGSASSDFYGGNREGKNLFGNCVVALDAATGKLKWYFQTVQHDLWDRDLPCPPNLATITHNGKKLDVVVQVSKDGLVYVLERDSGVSIFPMEERSVPTEGGLPGEHPYPVQKFPLKPKPLSHQVFTEDIITDLSPESYAYVKEFFDQYRTDEKFALPNEKGTIMFGYSGGAEWGGNATDLDGVLYQNSNDDPWLLVMEDAKTRSKEREKVLTGEERYQRNCAMCHGVDRTGTTEFPSLMGIGERSTEAQILELLESGTGRMPSFQHIPEEGRRAIAAYILDLPTGMHQTANPEKTASEEDAEEGKKFGYEAKYVIKTWKKLTDQNGYPAIKPPWGTLNAIDLSTGEYLWRVPLGEYPELTEKGVPITGTESYGGPIVTSGGLVFIAGTKDEKIRAFDKKTGAVVWEHQLPAGGFATPITYEVDGKQYVVIAAGGGRGQKPGGDYIAFALKE